MNAVATRVVLAVVAVLVPFGGQAFAQDDVDGRLKALEERIRSQDAEIQKLRSALDARQSASDSLEAELDRYLSKADEGSVLGNPKTMMFSSGSGTKGTSGDKKFKFQAGGRIMWDQTWFGADSDVEDAYGDFYNMVEPRRARFFIAGEMYGNIKWKAQYDFGGGDADFKDVYVALKGGEWGTWTFGHHKEPFSLEEQTSSKYMTFMERGLPNALSPGRNVGLSWHKSYLDGNLFPAIGIFHDVNDYGVGRAGKDVTLRIAGTPVKDEETLVHLGAAFSRRDPASDVGRVRQRPEAHTTPRVVDTGSFDVDSENLLGLEGAVVHGPFSLQTEYMSGAFDSSLGGDPTLAGWYVYGSFFVTGESRAYKGGSFARVKPRHNFDGEGGTGAIEVALRYSTLDLDDGDLEGGNVDDWTLGVNWYLNPNTRVMVNYVTSDTDSGDVDGFLIRVQIDF